MDTNSLMNPARRISLKVLTSLRWSRITPRMLPGDRTRDRISSGGSYISMNLWLYFQSLKAKFKLFKKKKIETTFITLLLMCLKYTSHQWRINYWVNSTLFPPLMNMSSGCQTIMKTAHQSNRGLPRQSEMQIYCVCYHSGQKALFLGVPN